MSLRSFALLSARAGSGRSTLAANLGDWLGRSGETWLLENTAAAASEIALRLGRPPQSLEAALQQKGPGLRHVAVAGPAEAAGLLERLADREASVLLDGVDLEQPQAQAWLAPFGAVLLVENGDLQGCRRALTCRRALEASHRPLSSVRLLWNGEDPSQPLPPLEGLSARVLPRDPRAWERLGQGRLWVRDEPKGPLARAFESLAVELAQMPQCAATAPAALAATPPALDARHDALLERLGKELRESLQLDPGAAREAVEPRLREAAEARLAREDGLKPPERAALLRRLIQDMVGLGPLEDLLEDPAVSEIMVNHPGQIYVEREGRLSLSPVRFRDERHLRTVIERIVWPLGRRIDESSPKVDARLADGSRVNAIIPPLALKGSCLTIRRFPRRRPGLDELVAWGALSAAAAELLRTAVVHKRNILVSGGTGSGKTTLLNALSAHIPPGERVITLEDAAELSLQQPHVVSLESRPPNLEGKGEISIRELLKNALRMRPDRIVVGEVRGGEALDMLQAMNTGHEGSLSTVHANSPREAVQRLETLCLLSGLDLPLKVARQQIASAIDLIVQVGRLRDGSRKVLAITELCGMEGEVVQTQDLFVHRARGSGPDGRLLGALEATGTPARFYQRLREEGESVDFSVFSKT